MLIFLEQNTIDYNHRIAKRSFTNINSSNWIYYFCISFLFLILGVKKINGLKCVCNPDECDIITPQECPGRGYIVWDPCKCCKVCAKTFGEACGGLGGFSGTCEPPLQCVIKPPVTGTGVCLDLTITANGRIDCQKIIYLESGCEIVNRKCRCWSRTKICNDDTTKQQKWDFKTNEDCQLNLQNLVRAEIEFDEDYTVPPKKNEIKCTADIQCPPIRSKVCPSDSNLEIMFNQFYVEQKDRDKIVQYKGSSVTNDKAVERNASNDLGLNFHREVRDINSTYEKLISHCCPYAKCVCKPQCDIPLCEINEIPIALKLGIGYEGSCCTNYKCQPKPVCTALLDYQWYQPCMECRCAQGQHICIDICNKQKPEMQGCQILFRHFKHGEKWKENNDCTECECINGQHKCISTMCKTISCSKQIKLLGQCCPICETDDITLEYCEGFEHCDNGDHVCPTGSQLMVIHPNGCLQCRCVRQNQTITATTKNTISVTPDYYSNINQTINTFNNSDSNTFSTSTIEDTITKTTIQQTTIASKTNVHPHKYDSVRNGTDNTTFAFSCENQNMCINNALIISISAAIVFLLLLILLVYCFHIRRRKINKNSYKAVAPSQN